MNNLSKVYSAELEGIEARLIEVETDINVGLHSFNIVGLADKALSEAKERVNSALKNIGVKAPNKENRKIVVNLAPADVKKTGSHYDLAIAIGYLSATQQIKTFDSADSIFVGELSLEGKLRPVHGALSVALLAKRAGFQNIYLPAKNSEEAAIVSGIQIFPIENLTQLINHLEERELIPAQPKVDLKAICYTLNPQSVDISEVKGQENAKRALAIAAAGGHNLIMIGPPGTGKTMLAQALVSILPPPSLEEMIEATQVHSSVGALRSVSIVNQRPFRSPHHSASPASIIGGGQNPKPGEISLAHRGVLFLDELPEFRRDVLEALRQPLESGKVFVSRARGSLMFPARFMLVAAMNPCPCGFYGDEERACQCGAFEVHRYQRKISGPLLDRIDLQIHVPRLSVEQLREKKADYAASENLRAQIFRARTAQAERLRAVGKLYNSEMSSKECDQLANLSGEAEAFVKKVFAKSLISARGFYRTLKVARTIADLDNAEKISETHLAEALTYRLKEV